jgi:hypothetical protein
MSDPPPGIGAGNYWLEIPRWQDFQHYRDRSPTWIKNYVRQLHDDAYRGLTMHQRGILHGLRLAYAASDRQLRDSTLSLTRQLGGRVTTRDLEALYQAGFITLSASKPLAPRYHDASPEKEKEKEGSKGPTARVREASPATPTAPARRAATNQAADVDCPRCNGDRLIPTEHDPDTYRPCPECGVHATDGLRIVRTHAEPTRLTPHGELEEGTSA